MNLSDQEKQAIESQTKKTLGFSVNLDNLNITTEQVENGIMSLLESERSKRKASYKTIWVRAFLIEEKKMFSSKMEKKLRLQTYWVENGKLTKDAKPRKLMSYTSLDFGGYISKVFIQMIQGVASEMPNIFESDLNCSIYFQFNVEDENDPKLEVNFVVGENPKSVVQQVNFKEIFNKDGKF